MTCFKQTSFSTVFNYRMLSRSKFLFVILRTQTNDADDYKETTQMISSTVFSSPIGNPDQDFSLLKLHKVCRCFLRERDRVCISILLFSGTRVKLSFFFHTHTQGNNNGAQNGGAEAPRRHDEFTHLRAYKQVRRRKRGKLCFFRINYARPSDMAY